MCEILELPPNFISPLDTVKKVVAKPVDDNEQRRCDLGKVSGLVLQNSFHQLRLVIAPKIQVVKVVGEGSVREVPVPNIRKRRLEGPGREQALLRSMSGSLQN